MKAAAIRKGQSQEQPPMSESREMGTLRLPPHVIPATQFGLGACALAGARRLELYRAGIRRVR
jgi:hypothetical protein